MCTRMLVERGKGKVPGGMKFAPPAATGVGDWDVVGGIVGEGGTADRTTKTNPGKAGCVRIFKPGFCAKTSGVRWWITRKGPKH